MSASSDHTTPTPPNELHDRDAASSWDELATCVRRGNRDAFDQWLDAQLTAMESDLQRFSTPNSRFREGRR
ncbi:hypothetical protein FYK55_01980 [Roseiconus nitratireducens]|uniref:Uncharacterized protein n=1 Tax=Roseiconus nitratireducens TaxID=2605748 RepID=A0A5M6DLC0_9BACT|nr:hypothetical protein [Roseiconus nitratireducens]KAA5547196.1 hypothetical protein FYK55_01980 [Roseiconus nitratireducens]